MEICNQIYYFVNRIMCPVNMQQPVTATVYRRP